MNKVIITTTIQYPTEAIEKFDALKGWTLVVVGDIKTPKNYRLKNGVYISPEEQEKFSKALSDAIGWNNHGRRNFGNLWAKRMNADIVAIVDDDNIPLDHWGENLLVGNDIEVNYYEPGQPAFDPVGATNYPYLWHRGFPVQLLANRDYSVKNKRKVKCDIQADFWNGDPDVDAICRMIYAPECQFDKSCFPIASNKPSPFNSQNTFIGKEVLPHYFVLPHISPLGRESDIWISYHVLSMGFNVVYSKPSVYQKRNSHDLTKDMEDEFIGYKTNIDIVKSIVNKSYNHRNFWPKAACKAYEEYQRVFKKEKRGHT